MLGPSAAAGPSAELGRGDGSVGRVLFRASHAAQQLKEKEAHSMNFCLQNNKVGKGKMEKESRNGGVKMQNWVGEQEVSVIRIGL